MRRLLSIIITLLFLGQGLFANERLFRNISMLGNHGNSTVREFYRDSEGFCWMGIDNLLVRFDGSHLVDFPIPKKKDRNVYVAGIGSLGPDYVLAGTNTGLWRLSRKKPLDGFVRVFEKEIESVSSLSVVDSVTVAIGTSKGMKIYRHGSDSLSTVLFNRQPFSPENRILASVCDKSLIYVVTKAGIFSLDVSTNAIKSVVADAAVGDASSIAVAGDNIFVGSHTSGLYVFSATKGILRQNVDVGCNVVTSLSKGENGNVFVGTDGNGVVEVNGETLNVDGHLSKRTPKGGELTSDQVYAVLAYGDQELWIGYYQAAADYLLNVGSRFKIYDTEAFDTHGITIRTLQLSDDGLMLGSRNGVYYILPDKKTVRHIEMPRIRSNMVLTIHKAGGLYYVGTYGGGCFVYDPVSDKVTSLQDDGKPVLDKGGKGGAV